MGEVTPGFKGNKEDLVVFYNLRKFQKTGKNPL